VITHEEETLCRLTWSFACDEEDVGGLSRGDRNKVISERFQIVSIRADNSDLVTGNSEKVIVVHGGVDNSKKVGFVRLYFELGRLTWQSSHQLLIISSERPSESSSSFSVKLNSNTPNYSITAIINHAR